MKAVIQRVSRASVSVDQKPVGSIGAGMLIFVCAEPTDGPRVIRKFVDKVLKLRIFADDEGKMNRNIVNIDGKGQCGGLLIVSQFTLAADLWAGNRPSFTAAAPPHMQDIVMRLYSHTQKANTPSFKVETLVLI